MEKHLYSHLFWKFPKVSKHSYLIIGYWNNYQIIWGLSFLFLLVILAFFCCVTVCLITCLWPCPTMSSPADLDDFSLLRCVGWTVLSCRCPSWSPSIGFTSLFSDKALWTSQVLETQFPLILCSVPKCVSGVSSLPNHLLNQVLAFSWCCKASWLQKSLSYNYGCCLKIFNMTIAWCFSVCHRTLESSHLALGAHSCQGCCLQACQLPSKQSWHGLLVALELLLQHL